MKGRLAINLGVLAFDEPGLKPQHAKSSKNNANRHEPHPNSVYYTRKQALTQHIQQKEME